MMDFTWVDFIIFGVIFLNTIAGFARGAVKEIVSILVLIVALVITIKFTATIANFLNTSQGSMDVLAVFAKFLSINATEPLFLFTWGLALLLLFVGVFCIGETVNYYTSIGIITFPLQFLGRLIGVVLGFIRGYAFALILLLVLGLTPVIQTSGWTDSMLVQKLNPAAQNLGSRIKPGGFPVWTGAIASLK